MNAATLSGPNTSRSMTPAMRASRLLGWVSFAIGAAELLAPRRVARAVGMDEDRTGLLRAYGAREMVAGVGAHSIYPVPALWSRVAGDLLDIGTLALAARDPGNDRSRNAWIAIAAVAGIAVIDAIVAAQLTSETSPSKGNPKDYSDRSGFPDGVEAARGAGIVRDQMEGKAGGAAAGDSSPAGKAATGRSSTDLVGAPQGGDRAAASSTDSSSRSAIGDGKGMPEESKKVIPEPQGYTPV